MDTAGPGSSVGSGHARHTDVETCDNAQKIFVKLKKYLVKNVILTGGSKKKLKREKSL